MNILVGKTFGVGNLVMAVPMLKALKTLKGDGRLDLLIGSLPDDAGSIDVAREIMMSGIVDKIYVDHVHEHQYDVAIMAIPFDGRWKNGVHFISKDVMDGRTRPDPSTTGLISWNKHEVLYQMENADALGYKGGVPDPKFIYSPSLPGYDKSKTVYLGMGYKKDAAGFWKFKHWGNEKYAELARLLSTNGFEVVTTGDMLDLRMTIRPIINSGPYLKYIPSPGIQPSFYVVSSCGYYIGNDTGMMHIAASQGLKTLGIFMDLKLITKNHPWTPKADLYRCMAGWNDISPENVFNEFMDFVQES